MGRTGWNCVGQVMGRNGGRGVDGALKNFMVFNDDATDADVQLLANFNVGG